LINEKSTPPPRRPEPPVRKRVGDSEPPNFIRPSNPYPPAPKPPAKKDGTE
jgi:hypothetical protein